MDHAPAQFIMGHQEQDLKPFTSFVHRTFNATDLLYFIQVLKAVYTNGLSLEDCFVPGNSTPTVEFALVHFHNQFFRGEYPNRSRKHIATPERGSACKRLNMYLRWMVRHDNKGVDFGIWNKIKPAQLICPLDVHVSRVAHRLGLLPIDKANWKNACTLTSQLLLLNPEDPAVYDFALFSLGAEERF